MELPVGAMPALEGKTRRLKEPLERERGGSASAAGLTPPQLAGLRELRDAQFARLARGVNNDFWQTRWSPEGGPLRGRLPPAAAPAAPPHTAVAFPLPPSNLRNDRERPSEAEGVALRERDGESARPAVGTGQRNGLALRAGPDPLRSHRALGGQVCRPLPPDDLRFRRPSAGGAHTSGGREGVGGLCPAAGRAAKGAAALTAASNAALGRANCLVASADYPPLDAPAGPRLGAALVASRAESPGKSAFPGKTAGDRGCGTGVPEDTAPLLQHGPPQRELSAALAEQERRLVVEEVNRQRFDRLDDLRRRCCLDRARKRAARAARAANLGADCDVPAGAADCDVPAGVADCGVPAGVADWLAVNVSADAAAEMLAALDARTSDPGWAPGVAGSGVSDRTWAWERRAGEASADSFGVAADAATGDLPPVGAATAVGEPSVETTTDSPAASGIEVFSWREDLGGNGKLAIFPTELFTFAGSDLRCFPSRRVAGAPLSSGSGYHTSVTDGPIPFAASEMAEVDGLDGTEGDAGTSASGWAPEDARSGVFDGAVWTWAERVERDNGGTGVNYLGAAGMASWFAPFNGAPPAAGAFLAAIGAKSSAANGMVFASDGDLDKVGDFTIFPTELFTFAASDCPVTCVLSALRVRAL